MHLFPKLTLLAYAVSNRSIAERRCVDVRRRAHPDNASPDRDGAGQVHRAVVCAYAALQGESPSLMTLKRNSIMARSRTADRQICAVYNDQRGGTDPADGR